MAWAATHTFAVGEVLSASNMNLMQANINDLDRRTTLTGAQVLTQETTASLTYVAIATAGPAVTVTIGSTGKCTIDTYCGSFNSTANVNSLMAFAISGATTVASSDDFALQSTGAASVGTRAGSPFLVSSLTAGSNTFTAQYRVTAGTGNFLARKIIATPLGS